MKSITKDEFKRVLSTCEDWRINTARFTGRSTVVQYSEPDTGHLVLEEELRPDQSIVYRSFE